MGYCLTREEQNKFTDALRDGRIHPEKLISMSSADRHKLFTDVVGADNAKAVNALVEQKLLQKNQQAGMVNWAQNVLGMRPKAKRDLISRIERLNKVLDPVEEKAFLTDLAEQKLGVSVSFDEAKVITDLSQKVKEAREKMEQGERRKLTKPATETEMEYGRAAVVLHNYVNDLKISAEKTTLTDIRESFRDTTMLQKAGKAAVLGLRGASHIPGFLKSVKSAFDNSAIFLQGFKTLTMHPVVWQRNARKSFADIWNTFGGRAVMDELNADILSRPTYEKMLKAKLDVGTTEEAFPSNFLETADTKLTKVAHKYGKTGAVALSPYRLIPRAYTASQNAYTGFVHKTRADVFDLMLKLQEKNEYEMPDNELPNLGRMVNSMVGRGNLGRLERAAASLNVAFFSPRNLKAHVDTLLQPLTGGASLSELVSQENTGSSFVRKEAAKNLLKMLGALSLVMAVAKLFCDECVELDPRSANFGTIKYRNTRFDITGGQKSLWVLASRLLTQESKSGVTDEVRPINATDKQGKPLYGATTSVDLVEDFFENKMSPAGGMLKDLALGRDFKGNPVSMFRPSTYGQIAWNATAPFPVDNANELLTDPNAAPLLVSLIASTLGVNTSTYGGVKDIEKQIEDAKQAGNAKEVQRLKAVLPKAEKIEEAKKEKLKAAIFDDNEQSEKGFISSVKVYAKAIGTDPITAFNRIMTGQRIRRVDNDTIIIVRDEEWASSVRKKRGATQEVILDHRESIQLGGPDSENNVILVPRADWLRYTPIENMLGEALRASKIKGADARQWLRQFKDNKLTATEVQAKIGTPESLKALNRYKRKYP